MVPHRVISLSPHFTEILYDIGAQDRLVGVTKFCRFPPEARNKQVVGDFYRLDYERIVALKPDLVLISPSNGKAAENLKNLGIPFWVHDNNSIRDVLETYDALGVKLGCADRARQARGRLEERLESVRKKGGGRKPISILFVVGHGIGSLQQIYAAGPHSFIGEMITWTGGRNILEGTSIPFPLVSKERLLKQDPDVIVDSMPSDEATGDTIEKARQAWGKLPFLKAVRQDHLYFLKEDEFLIPGPTMVGLAEYLSGIFARAQK